MTPDSSLGRWVRLGLGLKVLLPGPAIVEAELLPALRDKKAVPASSGSATSFLETRLPLGGPRQQEGWGLWFCELLFDLLCPYQQVTPLEWRCLEAEGQSR